MRQEDRMWEIHGKVCSLKTSITAIDDKTDRAFKEIGKNKSRLEQVQQNCIRHHVVRAEELNEDGTVPDSRKAVKGTRRIVAIITASCTGAAAIVGAIFYGLSKLGTFGS